MSTSPFDFIDEEPNTIKGLDKTDLIWNIFSVLTLVAILITGIVFLSIFVNPQSGLNPLPPATMPSLVVTITPTPTPKNILPPTWTPLPSNTPLPTGAAAPLPTETPAPKETLSQTETSAPTPTVIAEEPFVLQAGSPIYLQNFAHQEAGCQWFGVAGQIFDVSGTPIIDSSVIIEIGGILDGEEITQPLLTLSGMASGATYGAGGYEIILGDHPIASTASLWIQLSTPSAEIPLSGRIYFDTFEDCEKNLILLSFVQED